MTRSGLAARMARNASYAALTSMADALLLLLLVIAGRLLGASDFGVFSLALAWSNVLVFLTALGLDPLLVRELAIGRVDRVSLVGAVLTWKLAVSAAALVVYLAGCALFLEGESVRHAAYLMGPAAICRSFNMAFRSVFQGIERFSDEARIVLVERAALLALGLGVLSLIGSPVALAGAFLAARGLTTGLYALTVRRALGPIRPTVDASLVMDFQRRAFPLGVASLLFGISMQTETLLLGWLAGPSEVGLYSAAMKVFEGALVIPLIFNSVFYPRLSHASESDPQRFRDLAQRSLKYVLVMASPLLLLGPQHADLVIHALFGPSYADAAPALSLLLVALAIQFAVSAVYTQLRSLGEMALVMRAFGLALLVKVATALVLIPLFGIAGAALSAVLSGLGAGLLALGALQRRSALGGHLLGVAVRILGAGVLALALDLGLPEGSPLIRLLGGLLLFSAGLVAFGVVDREERMLVRSLVRRGISK